MAYTYEMDMVHFANPSLSVVVEKCCFLGIVVWDKTYMCNDVFSLCRNTDQDDRIVIVY